MTEYSDGVIRDIARIKAERGSRIRKLQDVIIPNRQSLLDAAISELTALQRENLDIDDVPDPEDKEVLIIPKGE